jgi:restriction endonuclease S subunit
MVVRANVEVVDPEFLPFLMQSDMFMQRAIDISVGSLSPTINWKTLRIQEFPLPPKDEQRRIADILWAAYGSCEAYARVLNRLNSLADTKARGAFSAPSETRDSADTLVPLGELAEVRYGLTVDGSRRKLPQCLPYLRVANVQRGKLELSEVKEIGADHQDVRECSLMKNDVLVVEGHADPTEIGRAAIWKGQIEVCLHQNHILRIRASGALLPEYLLALINSPTGKSHFRRFAKSSSGLYTINSTVLRDMRIRLPSKEDQQLIVDGIEAIQHQIGNIEKHLDDISNLKKALVRELLGESDVH